MFLTPSIPSNENSKIPQTQFKIDRVDSRNKCNKIIKNQATSLFDSTEEYQSFSMSLLLVLPRKLNL